MSSIVSIIVPVYKADEWIRKCLSSIEAQTYPHIELIVIEDPLGTGAARARNRGLDKATGEFIMFCDADDYLESSAVEKLITGIGDSALCIGSFRKFGNIEAIVSRGDTVLNRRQVADYVMGNLRNPRGNQILSGCWAKLYRHYMIGRFPDLVTAEDMGFNFDYLRRSSKVSFISDVVYHNQKRNGSLSTTFNESDKSGLFGFLEGLKFVRRFLEEFYTKEELEDALDSSKVYHAQLYFMRICDQGGSMRDNFMRLYP